MCKCGGGSGGDNNGNVTRTGGPGPPHCQLWSKPPPLSTLMAAQASYWALSLIFCSAETPFLKDDPQPHGAVVGGERGVTGSLVVSG